jgi:hypothetical protein
MRWRTGWTTGGYGVAVALLLGLSAAHAGAQDLPEDVAYCLMCHEDQAFSQPYDDGSPMSLHVDVQEFLESVHGSVLVCTDCHSQYDETHPSGATFPSERVYVIGAYTTCKECHFDTYTRTLESVHYELLKSGFEAAPVCTDCHGAHNVQDPHAKRAMVSRSCAACHTSVYDRYALSVHGRALVEDDNREVPACADCHTHHQIQEPGTIRFRLGSPASCLRCHGDDGLMATYGLSTTIGQTYLSDFHGVTASLTHDETSERQRVVVTCADCHGTHEVASPRLLGDETMKATVAETCARCHEGASPDFPAAWLSHYTPSLQHAPLVYIVELFYGAVIPFVVIGLVLNLMLQVYRMSAGR